MTFPSNAKIPGAALYGAKAALVACAMLQPHPALAQDPSAKAVLKSMTDYVTAQHDLSFKFDSALEAITDNQQKVTFASSGSAVFSSPNKFRIERHGGYTDVDLVSDGTDVVVSGNKAEVYARSPMPDNMEEFVHRLAELGVNSPGADLLLPTAYDQLTAGVTDSAVIGSGIVDGQECQHLAFRAPEVDWQLWVRTGSQPLPCLYIVTSKHIALAPQYSIRFGDWKVGDKPPAKTFEFKPTAGATEVDLSDVNDLEELPEGAQ